MRWLPTIAIWIAAIAYSWFGSGELKHLYYKINPPSFQMSEAWREYERMALAFWEKEPSCAQVTYRLIDAQSMEFLTGYDDADGATYARECLVVFNRAVFTYYVNYEPDKACQLFVHEWGHLLGKGHSKNARSMMYYFNMGRHPFCESWEKSLHSNK